MPDALSTIDQLTEANRLRYEAEAANQAARKEIARLWTELDRVTAREVLGDLARKAAEAQLAALQKQQDGLVEALRPLQRIGDAYDANELDDEARKHWGKELEFTNPRHLVEIELYAGRGGKQLLTLADCLAARQALSTITTTKDGSNV